MKTLLCEQYGQWQLSHGGGVVMSCFDALQQQVYVLDEFGKVYVYTLPEMIPQHLWTCKEENDLCEAFLFLEDLGNAAMFMHSGKVLGIDPETMSTTLLFTLPMPIRHVIQNSMAGMILCITDDGSLLGVTYDWDICFDIPLELYQYHCTWRPDGQYFALIDTTENHQSTLRIFDRYGQLHAQNTSLEHMVPCISWSSNHALIVIPQSTSGQSSVLTKLIFFELNGLVRNEFVLSTEDNVHVSHLSWSEDSELLAVTLKHDQSFTQFWSRNNYTWMLKHTIEHNSPVVLQHWGNTHDKQLFTCTQKGIFSQCAWVWQICVDTHHFSTMAFIDGQRLCLTPMQKALVPPPMAMTQQHIPATNRFTSAIEITFAPQGTLAILDSTFTLSLWSRPFVDENGEYMATPDNTMTPTAIHHLQEMDTRFIHARHLTFLNDHTLVVVVNTQGEDAMAFLSLSPTLHLSSWVPLPDALTSLTSSDGDAVLFATATQGVFRIRIGRPQCVPFASSPPPTPTMGVIRSMIYHMGNLITLTSRGLLCVNTTQVSTHCSSMGCYESMLLFIDESDTQMKFVLLQSSTSSHDTSLTFQSFHTRGVELGSSMVTCMANDIRTVLHMPRGNFEVIATRPCCLHYMATLLQSKSYHEAFQLLRRNRMDMNLLVDHDITQFITDIPLFLNQITCPTYLNMFITSLKNTNSLAKYPWYADIISNHIPPIPNNGEELSKCNLICTHIREILVKKDSKKYISTIMTCYAQQTPPKLQEALLYLKSSKDESLLIAMLKHLLFLTKVDILFNVALKMYDLPLAKLIMTQSQQDPKEYLPFIQELQQENLLPMRQYKIDMRLKQYKLAITHLHQCGSSMEDACVALIVKHELFAHGIQYYQHGTLPWLTISSAWGAWYAQRNLHKQASIQFSACKQWPQAMEQSLLAHQWHQAYYFAQKMEAMPTDLGRRVIEMLTLEKQWDIVAYLYIHHTQEPLKGMHVLLQGQAWDLARYYAIHVCSEIMSIELVEQAIETQCEQFLLEVKGEIHAARTHQKRLCELRETYHQAQETAQEDGEDGGDTWDGMSTRSDFSFLSSLASSATSGSTATRRMKKKRGIWKIREGSNLEEPQRIHTLRNMAKMFYSKEHIEQYTHALIQQGTLVLCEAIETHIDIYKNILESTSIAIETIPSHVFEFIVERDVQTNMEDWSTPIHVDTTFEPCGLFPRNENVSCTTAQEEE